METASEKSQPLHNFSLPHLKWGNKSHHASSSSNHRFRRRDSPSTELNHQHHHQSDGGESEDNVSAATKLQTGLRTARNHHHQHRFSLSVCSSKQQSPQVNDDAVVAQKETTEGKEPSWNLRPRKQVNFRNDTLSFGDLERVERNAKDNESRSLRLRGGNGEGTGPGSGSGTGLGMLGPERKTVEKRKLWISLSREEIEEDVYAWTGSRPSRRPKKRPKTIQKQLDNVFPGLYMVGATVDMFRAYDPQEALEDER